MSGSDEARFRPRPFRSPRTRWVSTLALLAVTVAVVLWVFGCSNPPEHGHVVRKTYSAPYEYPTSQCVAYRTSGSGISTCSASVTVYRHEPAHYGLCLRATNPDGGVVEGCREVAPGDYASYEVGDEYPRSRR